MSIVKKWQALTPEQRQRVVGGGEGVMLQASDLYSTKERETYADTEQTTVTTITKFCAHALRQYGTRDMLRGQSRALRVAFGMVHGVRTTMFDVLHDRSASIEYHGSLDKHRQSVSGDQRDLSERSVASEDVSKGGDLA